MKHSVVIIGSGNVATNLAIALKDECHIKQIYSRRLENARALAQMVGCDATHDLKHIAPDADVYIISVSDDAIASVIDAVPDNGALWLHTSGSTPIKVFAGQRRRYGVLYPMQSFSKSQVTNMSEVHTFIEGDSPETTQEIADFATLLSHNVHEASSHERERLHVAAVFACNFANHMFTLSNEVLDEAGLPFNAMLPLIKTTVEKLDHMTPQQSQTGPAARGDLNVIQQHLSTLTDNKRKIYDLLSRSIFNHCVKQTN